MMNILYEEVIIHKQVKYNIKLVPYSDS